MPRADSRHASTTSDTTTIHCVDAGRTSGFVEPTPLVIVEGFLGFPRPELWGDFEEHCHHGSSNKPRRKVIFAAISPVASLHDRACELFYFLRGGTVDYGEAHSCEHSHLRFGRTYPEPAYPQWSAAKPLHFLGHSLGGATITKLQYLLKIGFFGKSQHPDMMLSLTSLCAPHRGTQSVYLLGQSRVGKSDFKRFSFGWMMSKTVNIATYFRPLLPFSFDLYTESRPLSCHETSFGDLLKRLWRSDWTEGKDVGPYDTTFESAGVRENQMEGELNANTYYRSYSASMTRRKRNDAAAGFHQPSRKHMLHMPHLYLLSSAMGDFDFSTIRPSPSFLARMDGGVPNDVRERLELPSDHWTEDSHPHEAFYANDGMVPVFSQWHPFECKRTRCRHYGSSQCSNLEPDTSNSSGSFSFTTDRPYSELELEPGTWHVYHMENAHHHSIVPMWTGSDRQKAFWRDLGEWWAGVDAKALTSRVNVGNLSLNVDTKNLDTLDVREDGDEGIKVQPSATTADVPLVVSTATTSLTRNVKAKHEGHRRSGSISMFLNSCSKSLLDDWRGRHDKGFGLGLGEDELESDEGVSAEEDDDNYGQY